MIISKDVTARENKYSDIKKSANTDSLTGLYSRQYLDNMIRKYESAPTAYGLIMIDINGLKYINDNFSHNAGDAMLVKTAKIIRENVRKKDLVFRLGGDEFLILTTADEKTARQIFQAVRPAPTAGTEALAGAAATRSMAKAMQPIPRNPAP